MHMQSTYRTKGAEAWISLGQKSGLKFLELVITEELSYFEYSALRKGKAACASSQYITFGAWAWVTWMSLICIVLLHAICTVYHPGVATNASLAMLCASAVLSLLQRLCVCGASPCATPSNVLPTPSNILPTPSYILCTPSKILCTPSNILCAPSNILGKSYLWCCERLIGTALASLRGELWSLNPPALWRPGGVHRTFGGGGYRILDGVCWIV